MISFPSFDQSFAVEHIKMDFEGEQRFYGESTLLEPILEQQDDEVAVRLQFKTNKSFSFFFVR